MIANKSQKEKIPEQRHEQILKAAVEVFTRKGFNASTIPEIARSAGVATGTIYLYFPNKRELFIAVVKNIIFTIPMLNILDEMPTGNFEDVFKHIILDRFNLIETQNEAISHLPSLVGEVIRDPELKEIWIKDFMQPFLGKMEIVYRMMSFTDKIHRFEPSVLVRAIGGLILGLVMLKVMEGEPSPLNKVPKEKVAEQLTDFVLHGLLYNVAVNKPEKEGKK